ncbi:MAG: FAD-binding protein [Pseudomonadota bacterium]
MSLSEPDSEAALGAAVAEAAAAKTPLEITGGGTRRGLGRPVQAERTLSTAKLSGISLYEPGALTFVAAAGTPMAEVEAALAAEGQRLPFEPMDHRALLGTTGEPTLGGAVAVAAAGPRRLSAGGCRDSMIGVRFVNGEGQAISNGGRVMKNVTGYDLVKLMAGQYGTLGVLTEIGFKVLPKPETAACLLIEGLDDARAVACMAEAVGSPYEISGAAHHPVGRDGAPVTMLRIEGLARSVEYRTGELKRLLARYGEIAVETDPERVEAGWKWVRDMEPLAGREGAVWQLSVKASDAPGIVARLRETRDLDAIHYDWAGGRVWLLTPEEGDAGAAAIREETQALGGHATLMRASPATRAAVAVFEPRPAVLARIEAGLRARFDPAGVLNPGRMG